ncbi:MAG: AAA family ATPase [Bacteroidales bacterium]|nr:AAA family ATPase [Bacteroidales bacterium]
MFFKNIKLNSWQQFEEIDIDLSNKLTILTGANGSGKTTLLKLLSKHQGWQENSFAVPKLDLKTELVSYFSRWWKTKDKSEENTIGNILYSNDLIANLNVPKINDAQYQITLQNQQPMECFYIPSHRSLYKYKKVLNIPTQKKTKKMAFEEISNKTKERYFLGNNDFIKEPENNSFLMKSTLISWAIQGYGNLAMVKDQELIDNYEGFKEVLKKILPSTLGFENFEIRNMEIVFICNNGRDEFLLETASGGIGAIIDIAWQIYMYASDDKNNYTVIIDEIENHLHPTMQRSILPNLLNAFPNANFIVSTHSPLIVGSVKSSVTYALKYNESNKIESFKLDFNEEVKTATEILNDVLGVSFTMPIWVEDKLEEVIKKYSSKEMSQADFNDLRSELQSIGLEKLMPQAIVGVVGNK